MVRIGKLSGIALALAICMAASANAQTDEADDIPDADITPEAEMEPMFEQPVDLTTPMSPSASTFDPSKFMRGLPSPVWTGKAGIDNREGTPNADLRPGYGAPGTAPEQAVGVAWANVTAPGLMAWDKTAIETRVDPYQQSRFGVTLSRAVPVGSDVSMTLQNAFAWTQPLLQGATDRRAWLERARRRRQSRRPLHLPARGHDAVGRRRPPRAPRTMAPVAERGAETVRRPGQHHRRGERDRDRRAQPKPQGRLQAKLVNAAPLLAPSAITCSGRSG